MTTVQCRSTMLFTKQGMSGLSSVDILAKESAESEEDCRLPLGNYAPVIMATDDHPQCATDAHVAPIASVLCVCFSRSEKRRRGILFDLTGQREKKRERLTPSSDNAILCVLCVCVGLAVTYFIPPDSADCYYCNFSLPSCLHVDLVRSIRVSSI